MCTHRLILLTSTICLLTALVFAQADRKVAVQKIEIEELSSANPAGAQWLVLIGIDDYKNHRFLSDLKSCRGDAESFRDFMIDRFGYSRRHFIELYDDDATANRIRQTFYELPDKVGKSDSVLIYFAGHGFYDDKKQMGFWYAHDASGAWDGIANSTIKDWCRALPARKVLVVADSCFSGSLLTRSGFTTDATRKSRELLASGGLHPVADAGSPDGRHSIFNYYLRDSLERLARKGQPFVLNDVYVNLYTPVKVNSSQEPQKGIIQGALHEGGQFLFYPRKGSSPPVLLEPTPSIDTSGLDSLLQQEAQRQEAEKARLQFLAQAQDYYGKLNSVESSPVRTEADARRRAQMWNNYIRQFGSAEYQLAEARKKASYYEKWTAPPRETPRRTPRPSSGSPKHGDVKSFDLGGGVSLEMVYIEGGSFQMGSPSSEKDRDDDEGPVHTVELDGFWMGKYEVTQEQYMKIMGSNPSYYKGSNNPVSRISWNSAKEFCEKLSRRTNQTFRLPSEAEWEMACRAGSNTRFAFGDSGLQLGNYAWYTSNSDSKTHPVGQKRPNAWGFYDMHGNVWEWCNDWYYSEYYGNSSRRNPIHSSSGSYRVIRGGNWEDKEESCRSANRNRYDPVFSNISIGFRVAMSPTQ